MNTRQTLFGSLALAGLLAACGGGGTAAPSSAAPASVAAKPSAAPIASSAAAKPATSTSAAAKPAASGVAGGSAAGKPAAKPAPSLVAATSVATVKVAANPTLGNILTDGQGRTLYSFAPASDANSKDPTKCAAGCLTPWPPFLSSAAPTAPSGVTGKLGVITRSDFNVQQVTYDSMPLYYFVQDKAPGDAKGQNSKGFGGDWQVIKTS